MVYLKGLDSFQAMKNVLVSKKFNRKCVTSRTQQDFNVMMTTKYRHCLKM